MNSASLMFRYEDIASSIRESIQRETLKGERKLPSERALCRTYSAQRNTIRHALTLLQNEGLISSKGKSGWYILGSIGTTQRSVVGARVVLLTFRRHDPGTNVGIMSGLQEVLEQAGAELLHYDSTSAKDSQKIETIKQLTTIDADGIVLWPDISTDSELLGRLRDRHPLVLVDRRVYGLEVDSVTFDDQTAGQDVTQHLISLGHQAIAFLADEPFAESVMNRWQGYRQALEANGIEIQPNFSVFTHGTAQPMFNNIVSQLLESLAKRPTAIVCSNDYVASTLMMTLRSLGLKVPDDIAVTGFSNFAAKHLDVMGLTTMAQSFSDLGAAAGKLLLDRLQEPLGNAVTPTKHLQIPMQLIQRESCARLPKA